MARKRTYSQTSNSASVSAGTQPQYREPPLASSSPASDLSQLSPLSSYTAIRNPYCGIHLPSNSIADLRMDDSIHRRIYGQSDAAGGAIVYDVDDLQDMTFFSTTDPAHPASGPIANRLDTMPREVIVRILKYILVRKKVISPQFKNGTLRDGIYSKNDNDIDVCKWPNIDTSLLLINKNLQEIASKILYGDNYFFFDSAEVCKWWCKHIGDHNLTSVHHVKLDLDGGWWIEKLTNWTTQTLGPSDCCYEEIWYSAICRLKKTASLKELVIKFHRWGSDPRWSPARNREEKNEQSKWRSMIIYKLAEFRVKEVELVHTAEPWLSRRQVRDLIRLMTKCENPASTLQPRCKMGLSELISEIRINRLQHERVRAMGG